MIPSQAEVLVDCRVPPGAGAEHARERFDALLGPLAGDYEVEFTERVVGNSSPHDSPLATAIAASLAEFDPDAAIVPFVFAGLQRQPLVSQGLRLGHRLRLLPAARVRPLPRPRRSSTAPTSGPRSPTSSSPRASTPTSAGGCSGERGRRERQRLRGPASRARCDSAGWRMRNGLLIHGPTSWAVAARAPRRLDRGRLGPEAHASPAAGSPRPRCSAARCGSPRRWRSSRWPALRLRSARLPFEDPARDRDGAREHRRLEPAAARRAAPSVGRELAIAALGALPGAGRAARPRPRLLPRGRAQGDRRLRAWRAIPRDVPKEHERCGSNLVGPMLASRSPARW